jgi:hypothetical protein
VHYVPDLPQPRRTFVVALLAAALGAGIATATFAVVNIEDQPSVSLPAVQSAPPSDAVAGERADGGPEEGTAQQSMSYGGFSPNTGRPESAPLPRDDVAPPPSSIAAGDAGSYEELRSPTWSGGAAERYDGGPEEGSSAGAIAQP